MSASPREALIALLIASYPDLRRRLAGRFGSADLANDALQETYLRLHRADHLGEVYNPRSYLLRMAINTASNRVRAEARHLSSGDVDLLLEVRDETPDPLRVAEGRSELAAVRKALRGLPARRRAIFLRSWVEHRTVDELADEFGIAVRTIRHELMLATRHLHAVTWNLSVEDLQQRLANVSSL